MGSIRKYSHTAGFPRGDKRGEFFTLQGARSCNSPAFILLLAKGFNSWLRYWIYNFEEDLIYLFPGF